MKKAPTMNSNAQRAVAVVSYLTTRRPGRDNKYKAAELSLCRKRPHEAQLGLSQFRLGTRFIRLAAGRRPARRHQRRRDFGEIRLPPNSAANVSAVALSEKHQLIKSRSLCRRWGPLRARIPRRAWNSCIASRRFPSPPAGMAISTTYGKSRAMVCALGQPL